MNKITNQNTQGDPAISAGLTLFLAFSVCLILSNLYGLQPVLTDIARDIGLPAASAGLVITMAQIGYCCGVLFVVPLGDLVDNRRLISLLVLVGAVALLLASRADGSLPFLAAMFFVGLGASSVQIIIPLGVGMARVQERGKVIGIICAGGVLGMVLSRPASSLLTGLWGWRSVYLTSSVLALALGAALYRILPLRKPEGETMRYTQAFASMAGMIRTMPELRARVLFMAISFSCFTLFWSSMPIALRADLGFSHADVALFSLASILSPVFAVLCGRLADKGYGALTTCIAVCVVGCAFLITPVFGSTAVLFLMTIILLDAHVNMISIITQQSVLGLKPEARSRLNAICIAVTFCGGAIGSSLGPWIYDHYGWNATAITGAAMIGCAGAVYLLRMLHIAGKLRGGHPHPV